MILDYEQKYKEALERARDMMSYKEVRREDMEYIFPELKESEDEMIRKGIIKSIMDLSPDWLELHGVKKEDAIAWLKKQSTANPYSGVSFKFNGHTWGMCARDNGVEILVDGEIKERVFLDNETNKVAPIFHEGDWIISKSSGSVHQIKSCVPIGFMNEIFPNIKLYEKQGEQKSVDKVAPKFKVGDWVVYNRNDHSREVIQIYDIRDNRYYFNDNIHFSWSVKECDEKSHLWTIEDAKEGDVLDANGAPFIYKKHDKDCVYFYCGVNLAGEFIEANGIDTWNNNYKVYPATKEQRDQLEKAMANAGYKWDVNKKEQT